MIWIVIYQHNCKTAHKLQLQSPRTHTHIHTLTNRLTLLCQWAGGCWGGPELCRACHTLLYSALLWMRKQKEGNIWYEWWHGVQEWEVSKHRWGCTYLGLLFLIETLRGRVPVALGGCLHRTVFVVVLQIRTERCLCERAEELDTASDLRDNISDLFFKIPKRKKELCGSLLPAWV